MVECLCEVGRGDPQVVLSAVSTPRLASDSRVEHDNIVVVVQPGVFDLRLHP